MIELGVEAAKLDLGILVSNVATGEPSLAVGQPKVVLADLEFLIGGKCMRRTMGTHPGQHVVGRFASLVRTGLRRIPTRPGPPRPIPAQANRVSESRRAPSRAPALLAARSS